MAFNDTDRLSGGQFLNHEGEVISNNRKYKLKFLKTGHLKLYHIDNNGIHKIIWQIRPDLSTSKSKCVMKHYGHLVIFNKGNDLWTTESFSGDRDPGSYLKVQDDGNMVIYSSQNKVIWSTGTNRKH